MVALALTGLTRYEVRLLPVMPIRVYLAAACEICAVGRLLPVEQPLELVAKGQSP
jgi:hypothetical protein